MVSISYNIYIYTYDDDDDDEIIYTCMYVCMYVCMYQNSNLSEYSVYCEWWTVLF